MKKTKKILKNKKDRERKRQRERDGERHRERERKRGETKEIKHMKEPSVARGRVGFIVEQKALARTRDARVKRGPRYTGNVTGMGYKGMRGDERTRGSGTRRGKGRIRTIGAGTVESSDLSLEEEDEEEDQGEEKG